jgi:EpsI family protein
MTYELLGVALIVMLLGFAFLPAVRNLINSWSSSQLYSYGFLVPLISGGLIWMRRDVLRGIPLIPSLAVGSIVTGAGLLMLFAGRASTLNFVEQFALIVTICGLTLLMLGRRMFRALAFPTAYLITMIPIWDVFTARVHPYFQEYSATIGVAALQIAGIPVLRDGFLLQLPNITLEVAEECSGVNNLIAVLCVGIPVTYLSVRSWMKRGVIIGASILIALLSNGARVAMVSLFAYYGIRGADGDVHGPFALLRTMFVAGIGFIALFWLVSRLGDREISVDRSHVPLQQERSFRRHGLGLLPLPVALAIVMLSSANAIAAWHQAAGLPVRANLDILPLQLGRWHASGTPDSRDLEQLNFDQTSSRIYKAADGTEVSVFIGHYGRQMPEKELADYRMRAALVGPAASSYTTSIAGDTRVKDLLLSRDRRTQHVTYWYVLNGLVVPEDYMAKLHTAWNSIVHRKSEGALVVVRRRVGSDETIEVARSRVNDLVAGLASTWRP